MLTLNTINQVSEGPLISVCYIPRANKLLGTPVHPTVSTSKPTKSLFTCSPTCNLWAHFALLYPFLNSREKIKLHKPLETVTGTENKRSNSHWEGELQGTWDEVLSKFQSVMLFIAYRCSFLQFGQSSITSQCQ